MKLLATKGIKQLSKGKRNQSKCQGKNNGS